MRKINFPPEISDKLLSTALKCCNDSLRGSCLRCAPAHLRCRILTGLPFFLPSLRFSFPSPIFSGRCGVNIWCKGDTVLERGRLRRVFSPVSLDCSAPVDSLRLISGGLDARCEAPSLVSGSDHGCRLFQLAGSVTTGRYFTP